MMQQRIGTWYERYQKAQAWRENNGLPVLKPGRPGQMLLKQRRSMKKAA